MKKERKNNNLNRIANWAAFICDSEDEVKSLRKCKSLDDVLGQVVRICGQDAYFLAADFAWKNGQKEEAIQICESFGKYDDALKYCEENKMYERAVQVCKKQIAQTEKAHLYEITRSYAEKAGLSLDQDMIKRAFECFEREGKKDHMQYGWGGNFALKVGRKDAAIQFYEKGLWFEDAIKIALELGMKDKAQDIARKSIQWHEKNNFEIFTAAKHAQMSGLKYEAMLLYDKSKFYQSAIEIALELGMKNAAQEIAHRGTEYYSRRMSFSNAAKIAALAGMNDLADQLNERYRGKNPYDVSIRGIYI